MQGAAYMASALSAQRERNKQQIASLRAYHPGVLYVAIGECYVVTGERLNRYRGVVSPPRLRLQPVYCLRARAVALKTLFSKSIPKYAKAFGKLVAS